MTLIEKFLKKPFDIKLSYFFALVTFSHYLSFYLNGRGGTYPLWDLIGMFLLLLWFVYVLIFIIMTVAAAVLRTKKYWLERILFALFIFIQLPHSIGYHIACNFRSMGLHSRVTHDISLDDLQVWAVEILEKPKDELVFNTKKLLNSNDAVIPSTWENKQLKINNNFIGNYSSVILHDQANPEYVSFDVSGGVLGDWWGIRVGRKDYCPDYTKDENTDYLIKWQDGVYCYFGD